MDLPFIQAGTKNIVGESNFKDHYPNVNTSMHWSIFTPYIRQGIENYILPYVGDALYNSIIAKYQASATLTSGEAYFLEKIQDSSAYYTIVQALPFMNTVISDMGVQENTGKEGTSNPASMWRFKNTAWQAIKEADKKLDMLLAYMEKSIKEGGIDFVLWETSDEYEAGKACFFKTTADFSKFVNIQGSRRTFLALVEPINDACDTYVLPVLGETLYDDLLEKYTSNDVTTVLEDKCIKLIKKVAANFAMHDSLPTLRCVVEHDGIKTVSSTDNMDSKNMANQQVIAELRAGFNQKSKQARADLLKFLYDNITDFQDFKTSAIYVDPDDNDKIYCSEDRVGGILL